MSDLFKSQSGVTLFELVLVMVVSGVVGILLISIFVHNNSLFYNQQVKTSQNLDLNDATTKITKDVKLASAVVSSYTSGQTTFTSSSNTLILKIPSINVGGNTISNVSDYYVITLDNQNPKLLKEIVYPDVQSSRKPSVAILGKEISNLSFYYLDVNNSQVSPTSAVTVNFVINVSTFVNNSNQQSSTSGQVSLRNN